MNHSMRILQMLTPVLTAVLLSGCIVSDPLYVEYAIETNLAGEIVVESTGIHSNDDNPEKRKEEFKQYCDEGYLEQGQEWVSFFSLDDARIILTNRTDTTCEVVVKGKFDNLARALSLLAGEHDYEIRKSGPFFVARLLTGMAEEDDDQEFTVVIHYVGEIIAHNAHVFDEESGTMTWSGSNLDDSGVQFILKAVESNDE